MLENKLFEALLDVIPFKAYAVDTSTFEMVYANQMMRDPMYAPFESYCWEKVYGQTQMCSWCSVLKLQIRDKSELKEKYTCEFFDETDDKWLKAYDELMIWPDGREVKYSILVDITDQKEVQGDMLHTHAKLAMNAKHLKVTNKNLQITKLKLQKTINELEREKQKAEKATTSKSQFLANMSHEIRTPMNAVIGMTYLLGQTHLDEKQKNYLKKIDISSKNLLNIINDILDFSKIEAGKLELEYVNFSLIELLGSVEDIVSIKAVEKGLEFIIDYDTSKEHIYFGDPLRIGQILINLLGNAVKFTQNGQVILSIQNLQNNRILFEIKDTGIGLSEDQINRLFQSFTQANATISKQFGGTGLGLTISKELANLMDGDIVVESQSGVGSSFFVEIYLPQGDRGFIVKTNESFDDEYKNIDFNGAKILLVEDNHINQELIIALLENCGLEIDIANDGAEGIEKYNQNKNKYSLILMDIQMPIINGFEATTIIRKIDNNLPIIALTANAFQSDIEATKKALMDDHITKPIEIEKLYDVLKKYIPYTIVHNISNHLSDFNKAEQKKFTFIDLEVALKYLGGNKKLFLQVIQGFHSKYNDLMLLELDEANLYKSLHSIKGLCANIGDLKLYDMIAEFEKNPNDKLLKTISDRLTSVLEELYKIIQMQKKA